MKDWIKTVGWALMTGGLCSPLLRLPDSRPFRVVRCNGRLLVEPIPDQMDPDEPVHFEPGQRVEVRPHAGFSRGSRGEVRYHAPDGKVWVRRDGASSDVYFYPHELEPLE